MSAERALAAIEATGVDYQVTSHGPVSSVEQAAEIRGVTLERIIKSIVVRRAAEDYVFVLVPGGRSIAWPKLRAALGVNRLSLPDADEAFAVTGYVRGSITPFGARSELPVVADASIPEGPVSIGGGAHGTAFTIDRAELLTALAAQIEDVTNPD